MTLVLAVKTKALTSSKSLGLIGTIEVIVYATLILLQILLCYFYQVARGLTSIRPV